MQRNVNDLSLLARQPLVVPLTLVRDDGVPVTDADYRGRFLLLYFGFTYCPDVCPAELHKMSAALQLLEQRGIDGAVLAAAFHFD
jgi:cytochrome oxidase Cu insertion factor (SCO1/SenC/PrrC family)